MVVQCQILINKAKEGIHRAGNAVKGKVKYFIAEPTEYQHVTLSFIGKGHCVWRRRSNKRTRTYRGSEEYITHHINLCDKKPEDTITLEGEYEYPFEFFLPEDIPRSYKDITGAISYRVQLKFEKPSFFSFNKVFTAEIPVYSYLDVTSPEGPIIFGLEKTLFALFAAEKPVINLKAEITKTVLTPGENIHLSYVVANDTDVKITYVRTDLYCYTKYTADCGTTKVREEKVEPCDVKTTEVSERSVGRFSCILPTLPELYSLQRSKVISKEYRVRTMVILPMPHMNPSVELPVLIGEKKGSIDRVLEEEDPDEQPPSYWEAMSEDKENEKDKKKKKEKEEKKEEKKK